MSIGKRVVIAAAFILMGEAVYPFFPALAFFSAAVAAHVLWSDQK